MDFLCPLQASSWAMSASPCTEAVGPRVLGCTPFWSPRCLHYFLGCKRAILVQAEKQLNVEGKGSYTCERSKEIDQGALRSFHGERWPHHNGKAERSA